MCHSIGIMMLKQMQDRQLHTFCVGVYKFYLMLFLTELLKCGFASLHSHAKEAIWMIVVTGTRRSIVWICPYYSSLFLLLSLCLSVIFNTFSGWSAQGTFTYKPKTPSNTSAAPVPLRWRTHDRECGICHRRCMNISKHITNHNGNTL